MFTPGIPGGANWYGTSPNVTFVGSTGLFAQAVSYQIADCGDGTSNTVAYAESLLGDGLARASGGQQSPRPPGTGATWSLTPIPAMT